MITNDNSIKQGFVVPMPNDPINNPTIQVAPRANGLKRNYMIIQNLSSVNPIYISFKKPARSQVFGNYADGMIEIGPKQAWQEFTDEVHQGEVFVFINKPPVTPEPTDVNGYPQGIPFASVNYNGAYQFFSENILPVMPPYIYE